MKRCTASLVRREMQIKTTTRHHYTPIRMSKFKKKIHQVSVEMERNWNSHTLQGQIQNDTATLENILVFSYKDEYTLAVHLYKSTLCI